LTSPIRKTIQGTTIFNIAQLNAPAKFEPFKAKVALEADNDHTAVVEITQKRGGHTAQQHEVAPAPRAPRWNVSNATSQPSDKRWAVDT